MATDFNKNNTTISTTGGFKPGVRNTPLDIRTRVNLKADIDSIPNPFVGMKILVLQDETNNNEMTEYVVKSLKANTLGVANSKVDEVVLVKDFIGVPTKTSQLTNDSLFATETYVTNKIAEASLGGGETDLSGLGSDLSLNGQTLKLKNTNGNEIGTGITLPTIDAYTKNETNTIIQDYTGGKKQRYLTQAEYDILTDEQKNDDSIVYNITDIDNTYGAITNEEIDAMLNTVYETTQA